MVKRMILLTGVLIGLLALTGSILAQSDEITLIISLGNGSKVSESALQGFYDTHPGVKVVSRTNGSDMGYGGATVYDIEAILDKAEAYYSYADVVKVNMYNLTPFVTHAGYILDLTPYLEADQATSDDFYPSALKMYQWDGGVWGVSMALVPWFMTYDAAAFDAASYSHPEPSWTLDDYLEAGQALTVSDASGKGEIPGFFMTDYGIFARPVLGLRFYNGSTQTETPSLGHAEIEEMVAKLEAYNAEVGPIAGFDKIPLQMGGVVRVSNPPYIPVITSGAQSLVAGDGFAISAGTQHPELAYELVAYLTGKIETMAYFYGDVPARRSLQGQSTEDFVLPILSDEMEALLPDILENGQPTSELRYSEYLYGLYTIMDEDKTLTLQDALQLLEQKAIENLAVADARRSQPISVAPPDQ